MLNSLTVTLPLGTLLGFLAGMGVGGGSLLMLWLTAVLGLPREEARVINLLFFLPGAAIACLFRRKQGVLDLKKLLWAILAGTGCAALFSLLSLRLSGTLLKKAFGILLLYTGFRELFFRPKKEDPRTG